MKNQLGECSEGGKWEPLNGEGDRLENREWGGKGENEN